MLIDIHSHLDDNAFLSDLNDVIERARKVGISLIVDNGTNPKSNRRTLELSKRFEIIKPAFGIYPIDAEGMPDEEIEKEVEFIENSSPVAIGEIGLDYYYKNKINNAKKQKMVFERMISIAEKLKIPVIVHSRKAEEDAVNILESSKIKKVVLHCFQGNKNLVKKAEHNGWFFSIPPMIIYSKQQQMITEICENLLTESDAPYLGPVRGERNEPAFIVKTIEKIAEIKKMNKENVVEMISDNLRKLFKK